MSTPQIVKKPRRDAMAFWLDTDGALRRGQKTRGRRSRWPEATRAGSRSTATRNPAAQLWPKFGASWRAGDDRAEGLTQKHSPNL